MPSLHKIGKALRLVHHLADFGRRLTVDEWWATTRLVVNLARFSRELQQAKAPLLPVPEILAHAAVRGPYDFRRHDLGWGRATVPLDSSPLPVVVFSGGAAADGGYYPSLTDHWASLGIAVLQPEHDDFLSRHRPAYDDEWLAWERSIEEIWTLAVGDATRWRQRALDLRRLVDRLPEIGEQTGSCFDSERVAAGGYSFGARIALLSGGARYFARGRESDWSDTRLRAVLAISPEMGALTLPARVWRQQALPTLTVTGQFDSDVMGGSWRDKAQPFARGPGGYKYLAQIRGANHFSLSGRLWESATTSQDRQAQKNLFDGVLGLTSLFWRAHLLHEAAAVQSLNQLRHGPLLQMWRK